MKEIHFLLEETEKLLAASSDDNFSKSENTVCLHTRWAFHSYVQSVRNENMPTQWIIN